MRLLATRVIHLPSSRTCGGKHAGLHAEDERDSDESDSDSDEAKETARGARPAPPPGRKDRLRVTVSGLEGARPVHGGAAKVGALHAKCVEQRGQNRRLGGAIFGRRYTGTRAA